MSELQGAFPRPPHPEIKYAYLFDGDKRAEIAASGPDRWPALFLPTQKDPDDLFRLARLDVSSLAHRLHVPPAELSRFLDVKEASDAHDWVNDLADRYGRPQVLRTLAEMWVDGNEATVNAFLAELSAVL